MLNTSLQPNMRVIVIFAFVAILAAVDATRCHHGDLSQCTGLSCTNTGESVGCEHDVCTCMPAPQPCLSVSDCMGIQCPEKDRAVHCIDSNCACIKMH